MHGTGESARGQRRSSADDGRGERRQEERARQPEDDPGCRLNRVEGDPGRERGGQTHAVRAQRHRYCTARETDVARREGHRPAQFGSTGTTSTAAISGEGMPSAAAIEAQPRQASQWSRRRSRRRGAPRLGSAREARNASSACPRCVRAVRLRVVMAASAATPVNAIRTNTGQSGSAPAIEPTTTSSAEHECARDADHRQRAARAPEPILAVERIARTAPDARRRRAARARTS